MNINIQKNKLEQSVVKLQPFLDKKDMSQINAHILLEAIDNKIILEATDYEIYLKVIINDVEVVENGKTTFQGKKFLEIIKRLKNENINIKLLNNKVNIKQNRNSFKLSSFNYNEFPKKEFKFNSNQIKIDAQTLFNSLKQISSSIAINNPKYELNGALIDISDDYIKFVSTDTRRLAIVTQINNKENISTKIIIPKKAISEISKIFNGEIIIYYSQNDLTIKSDEYIFSTKLLNGDFPEYQRIIPTNTRYNIKLPKNETIEAIKMINSISNDIQIQFLNHKLLFKTLDDNDAEGHIELEIDNLEIAENLYLALNSRYILDFLTLTESDDIYIKINESNQPFVLEDKNFTTIIMPIII